MINVILWGAGECLEIVYNSLKLDCNVLAVIDNDTNKQNKKWHNRIPIISLQDINMFLYDYIVITVIKYNSIKNIVDMMDINKKKVIYYWEESSKGKIFDNRLLYLFQERKKYMARLDSAPYEWGIKPTPKIESADTLLKKIIKEKKSLCRFGDGEFEIMRGKNRAWFQQKDNELSLRLIHIFGEDNKKIITAVAQNFISLDLYKDDAADAIRQYMYGKTRLEIISYFNSKKKYYDAYVSRPYIIYKNEEYAKRIFALYDDLFKNRNIIVVEGEKGRAGINNGLFNKSLSVKRIVCPSCNAYEKYESILNTVVEKTDKDDLIYISLGPTATVLAYDLAQLGYQALDLGQLDNEYDWWKFGVMDRTLISGKFVAELTFSNDSELIETQEYKNQIIAKII